MTPVEHHHGRDWAEAHQAFLGHVANLNVYRSGERRAPHKPLLLLVAIARLLQGRRHLPFEEVETELGPLLSAYAPPVQARHQPALPYWHLRTDGLWQIPGGDALPLQAGGFPQMGPLRATSGHLREQFADALVADGRFLNQVVRLLLEEHFPESLHSDILAAVGLDIEGTLAAGTPTQVRRRDPRFRQTVLRAYDHRCAVTGFQPALSGSYFGCEAAHVQWHAYDGPDAVANGLALEPTLHKLFDVGAWSLSDDRRVIVSEEFSGNDVALGRIRTLHGRPLRQPLDGHPEVAASYILWHREPDLGGVFRWPALPL